MTNAVAIDHALRQERSPGDVAGIERQNLWQALLSHCRAQAVGPDEHVGADRAAVAKVRHDAVAALFESLQAVAAMVSIRRKSIAQDALHALPCGEHLRALKRYRHRTGLVQDFSRAHGDAQIPRFEPKRVHARYQFGLRHDTGAAVGQFPFHSLEDFDVPAAAAQHDCRQKTAHRAADHDRAALSGHRKFLQFPKLSPARKVFYIVSTKSGGTPWP